MLKTCGFKSKACTNFKMAKLSIFGHSGQIQNILKDKYITIIIFIIYINSKNSTKNHKIIPKAMADPPPAPPHESSKPVVSKIGDKM